MNKNTLKIAASVVALFRYWSYVQMKILSGLKQGLKMNNIQAYIQAYTQSLEESLRHTNFRENPKIIDDLIGKNFEINGIRL